MFKQISPAPPDAILGLTEAFKKDGNPDKINLGVGVYKDDTGATPVLGTVKAAEKKLIGDEDTKSYMPIPGLPQYGQAVQELLLGADHPAVAGNRARTAHTPGGTGGLRVGGDFLKAFLPDAKIWMSSPTWANHKNVFGAAGLEAADYPYYNAETKDLDFDGMAEALKEVPENDIVLLHACCHNPTGVDLSTDQWATVAGIAKNQGWIPFIDFAYQGFGDGVEEDRAPVAAFLAEVPQALVASSFSKNFGLYRERTGALTLIAPDADAADAAFSHVKRTIRCNYSNPPAHGGLIVVTVLGDADLRKEWEGEVAVMRTRIADMRAALVEGLEDRNVRTDFSFIVEQRGMFSFSGLNADQVAFLREEKSIYIVKGGRINVAGITSRNIDYLCDSIAEALKL